MLIYATSRVRIALLLFLFYECRAVPLNSEPCVFKTTGMLTNLTLQPNPPLINHLITISGELDASRNLMIIKLEGYLKDEESGVTIRFRALVCDLSESFCPVMKGEKRKLEYSRFLGSIWKTNTPLTLAAKLVDQDGKFVASVITEHCSLYK